MSVQIIDREIERWKDDMSVFGGINLCDGCFIFLDLLHFSLTAVEFSGARLVMVGAVWWL
jgi:hypothetical protein